MLARILASACVLMLATALPVMEVRAQVPTPTVSPDPLPDVPPTPSGQDPFPFFDDYSWRSFIALNWPTLRGAENRGLPDRTKAFGDIAGPRVWNNWKSRYEVFQPKGVAPSAWNSYDGANPCGPGFRNDIPTLSAFTAFGDFNQAVFSLDKVGNPLVAQNRNYARYEVRINRPEFDSIVGNKWYIAANLPTHDKPVPFNLGSTEIKAAWRILTDKDTPAIRARYYVRNAQVFDVAAGKCLPRDVALVGFHIVTKTPNRKQWIWSSFEHVDNVPGVGTGGSKEPAPPPGIPFSFNDPAKPQALDPPSRPPPVSPANPPKADPDPMQVIRKLPILPSTMKTNQAYWALPEIRDTVWRNYMLVMTQWPTTDQPEAPDNDGAPFPTSGSILGNTTMETYFQFDGGSCMVCHDISNRQGRDFVMFATFDAFRPGIAAPAESFEAKNVAGELAAGPAASLAADPMLEALSDFFEATENR
jgi:hypothetical protein